MILSVSRRTDVPNYFSEWFYNRIAEEFLLVRNPINLRQISKIDLSPSVVDCIVFWTKNPRNMLDKLYKLDNYSYYFQFTLTGYGKDVEPNIPDKVSEVIPTFRELSRRIGRERVVWRYDPILLNDRYTVDYHVRAFERIADALDGFTERAVISFVDMYAKTVRNMKGLNVKGETSDDIRALAQKLSAIAANHGIALESCSELVDLSEFGIAHGSCIDKRLIEKIIGCEIKCGKDKNQRGECGCFESIDIGAYNTCRNGCKYCYANFNDAAVKQNSANYDVHSPILCDAVRPEDKITIRPVKSLKCRQIKLW